MGNNIITIRKPRLFYRYAVWIFPTILTIGLLLLTLLSISGTSVGVYDGLFGQPGHTLAGQARSVRSDEWLVNTPLTISQSQNDYHLKNPDIGNGSDMAITVDVPYREWSTAFKPQNLAFFVLPLSMAFAFKWWFLSYALLLSVYYFIITFFKKRALLASLLAIFTLMSPFIQWWYQSITILSISYALLACTLAYKLTEQSSPKKRLILSAGLTYVLACFALLLYPPFQIASALVGLSVLIGFYTSRTITKKRLLTDLLWLGSAAVMALIIVGAFVLAHRTAVTAELHSVYPGHRVVQSGGFSASYLFGWPLSYSLQNNTGTGVFGNQSESSNFLLFGVLLLPYLAVCAYRRNIGNQYRSVLIALLCITILFMCRMFIPFGNDLYKLLGLSSVPLNRLFIGLGIINTIVVALTITLPSEPTAKRSWLRTLLYRPAILMGTLTAAYVFTALLLVRHSYGIPMGIGRFELLALIIVCSLIVYLLCQQMPFYRYSGLSLLVVFGLISSANVNPLYHGLGSLVRSPVTQAVAQAHLRNPSSAWIVSNKQPFEALPVSIGAHSYSGVYPYPQISLWHKYFPDNSFIYNRFAHVTFSVNDMLTHRSIQLVQGDTFNVSLPSCDPMLRELNINQILTTDILPSSGYQCFRLESTTNANGTGILIYQRR